MYTKLKYVIRIILILGIGFGIYSYLNMEEYIEFEPEFYPVIFLVGLIIIYYLIPKNLRIKSRILTFSALGIAIVFLLLTISLTLTHLEYEHDEKVLTEYSELSCEELEKRFETDLKEKELKHFSGGLGGSGNLYKNLKKYDIEHFGLGCVIPGNLNCYSELVWEHLKEKENVDINQLYE